MERKETNTLDENPYNVDADATKDEFRVEDIKLEQQRDIVIKVLRKIMDWLKEEDANLQEKFDV